jgi:lysophosphatidate acyltransferase
MFKLYSWQFEVRGRENLELHRSYVLVSNHQSKFDAITLAHYLPPRTTILAKRSLVYMGPLGIMLWLAHTMFVDRFNHAKAVETVNKTAKFIREMHFRVMVFPEGTRNDEGGFLPFKKGAFHIAIEGGLPIVPVVISSYAEWLNVKQRKFLSNGRIIITCLPPILTAGRTVEQLNELIEETRRAMLEAYQSSSLELSSASANAASTANASNNAASSRKAD